MAPPTLRDIAVRLPPPGPTDEWTRLPNRYASRRVALVVAGQIRRGIRAGWGPAGSFDARHGDDYVEVRFKGEPT
jgi:hypothetical protein